VPRTFTGRIVLLALAGLVIRVVYAIHADGWQELHGDALVYFETGRHLADGEGWRRAFEDVPTAEFPPGQSVLLAAAHLAGLGGELASKIVVCCVGAVTVGLIGVLGRTAAGDERVGYVAAGLAAVYPPLWVMSSTLLAETLYSALLVVALLAAYRALERPSVARYAVLGGAIGLAALTRGEALGLLVLVALPLATKGTGTCVAQRTCLSPLLRVGACALALVVVLAPWQIRNLTTFDRPVLISNNASGVWIGANCERTYFTEEIGAWRFDCYGRVPPPGDESERFAEYRRRGLEYMGDHLGRLPLVVAARVGRVWDVYRPWDQGVFYAATEGRQPTAHRLGLLWYWTLLPIAVIGAVILHRRRRPLLVLLAPFVLATLVAITTYGVSRFRFVAEPSIVVLASVALARVRLRR
jgi:hypothetical protein